MTGMNQRNNHNMQKAMASFCACQNLHDLAVSLCALFCLIIVNMIGRLIIF